MRSPALLIAVPLSGAGRRGKRRARPRADPQRPGPDPAGGANGPVVGGLLNATLGNAAERIIALAGIRFQPYDRGSPSRGRGNDEPGRGRADAGPLHPLRAQEPLAAHPSPHTR
ncbi:hypothetical protein [Thermoflexus sp.]|uniref:hypothetical protein n=1 Tax=Thermoflexus sp. TaxID=1969742 RepID=UPI0035E40521